MLNIKDRVQQNTALLSATATRSDVAEMKMMVLVMMSPDAREVFKAMVSKQDALRTIRGSTTALDCWNVGEGVSGLGINSYQALEILNIWKWRLPFHTVLARFWVDIVTTAFDVLCPDDSITEIEFQNSGWVRGLFRRLKYREAMLESSFKIKNFYEGHPLKAILLRDKAGLFEVLDNHREPPDLSSLDEQGDTTMSHLVAWPEGLQLVLQRYGSSILQLHDRLYGQNVASALVIGLYMSGQTCLNSQDSFNRCSDTCYCAAVVKMLLECDENILARTTADDLRSFWVTILAEASVKARELVIDSLALRREELRDFALEHLEPSEIDDLGLSRTDVLDQNTGKVLAALQAKGFVRLSRYRHPEFGRSNTFDPIHPSKLNRLA
ncbi:hypothetical protein CPLU01_13459 [Colletotrichum plurivorum]|uniref:Uncharacterized protein n=1 Tax=Colletotrichum plurivorum TaxID=2175906 RepID=A0A8H6JRL8_9PEZI|nr:hypothetical protein CPLU01_13459 [Colletotrichum plurivorum]